MLDEKRTKLVRGFGYCAGDWVLKSRQKIEALCESNVEAYVHIPKDVTEVELVFSNRPLANNFEITEYEWGHELQDISTTLFHEYFDRAMKSHFKAGRKYVHIEYVG